MKQELEEKLREEAPVFMKDLYGDCRVSCMSFGCECMDGWFPIILEAAKKIEEINLSMKETGGQIFAAQIKEKFGSLTIYLSTEGEVGEENYKKAHEYISKAEEESWNVCEKCGKPATVTTKGWIKRLCEACAKEREERKWRQTV